MNQKSGRGRRLSVQGALIWFSVSYGGAILGYLAVNAFASRLLGPGSFGYFVIVITASTIVGQLAILGVHRAGLREAARLEVGDEEGLRQLRRGVRAVALVPLPIAGALAAAVAFYLFDDLAGLPRVAVSAGVGLLVVLDGQKRICANHLRGLGKVRFASLLEGRSGGALVAVFQGALIGAVLIFFPGAGLAGALGACTVGYAIPVLLARHQVDRLWGHLDVRGNLFHDLRTAVSQNWRFASNQLGGYLNSILELWLAGIFLSSIDTSQFSAAQRLSTLLVIPMISLQVVFAPVVSRLVGKDDYKTLERVLRTGATVAAIVTAVAWVPILLAPDTLLQWVFGEVYRQAADVLIVLTLGNLANVLTGLAGTALMMSRHEHIVVRIQWLGVALRIVGGGVAASMFGLIGLGVSAAVVTAIVMIALWISARRLMDVKTHLTWRPSLRLLREISG